MAEIVKVYKERLPALRLIGKRYTNADREGGFGHKWAEWFQNGWFSALESLGAAPEIENGYLGFMRCGDDFLDSFEYWNGMFFPAGTPVPEGYEALELGEGEIGVCWIKGRESDGGIYDMHDACLEKYRESGMDAFKRDEKNRVYFFERYNCPRFTQPDPQGEVILDYCVYLEGR